MEVHVPDQVAAVDEPERMHAVARCGDELARAVFAQHAFDEVSRNELV